MNTCSMIGFFPACLFGVKKGLQILGENCFWMLGYSELYQPALTTSAHNNLPFFWNGLQLSYAIQRRDKKVILYASRLPIFTSILPLQYLFFPKYKLCFLQVTADFKFSDKNEKGSTTLLHFGFFFCNPEAKAQTRYMHKHKKDRSQMWSLIFHRFICEGFLSRREFPVLSTSS